MSSDVSDPLTSSVIRSHHLEHLRNQMTCMLHTLSSTFTTCACGSKSRDCVLRLMEAFVDYELPPKPPDTHVDFGPLVGRRRGFRTREKVPFSSGLTGVEMVALEPMSRAASSSSTDSEPHGRFLDANITPQTAVSSTSKPSLLPSASRKRRHDGPIRGGKGSSSDSDFDHSGAFSGSNRINSILTCIIATPRQRQKRRICSKMSNPDLAQTSNKRTMPPKMRKQWIHQTMQEATPRLTRSDEASGTEEELMDIGQGNCFHLLSAPRLILCQHQLSCLHHPCLHVASQRRQRRHQPHHPLQLSLHRLCTSLNYLYCLPQSRLLSHHLTLRPPLLTTDPNPRPHQIPLPPPRLAHPSNYIRNPYLHFLLLRTYPPSQRSPIRRSPIN